MIDISNRLDNTYIIIYIYIIVACLSIVSLRLSVYESLCNCLPVCPPARAVRWKKKTWPLWRRKPWQFALNISKHQAFWPPKWWFFCTDESWCCESGRKLRQVLGANKTGTSIVENIICSLYQKKLLWGIMPMFLDAYHETSANFGARGHFLQHATTMFIGLGAWACSVGAPPSSPRSRGPSV